MTQVVGVGAALLDILVTVDSYPKEDTKQQSLQTKFQGGGPCATALVAIRKLGVTSCYMGTLGDDMYGDFIRSAFDTYGVGRETVRTIGNSQSFYSVVLLNVTSASRTCIWNRGTVIPPAFSDIDLNVLKNAQYLHLDGHHMECAIYAAQKAKEFGVKVSLDAGNPYPGIDRLLPLVDVLIPSEEFALKVTGCATAEEASAQLQQAYHPEVLIITQGSRGGFIWENGQPVRYPVFPVEALDSNGAGDTFHGAFIAARVKGMSVPDAAAFASATSALKCTRVGAQEGIPSLEEVLRFMKENHGVVPVDSQKG